MLNLAPLTLKSVTKLLLEKVSVFCVLDPVLTSPGSAWFIFSWIVWGFSFTLLMLHRLFLFFPVIWSDDADDYCRMKALLVSFSPFLDPRECRYLKTQSLFPLCSFPPWFSSFLCSVTMTMPQCAAPTTRTTRTSVFSAETPASCSLKSLLCQRETVLPVCTFTSWHTHPHTQIHTPAEELSVSTLRTKAQTTYMDLGRIQWC